MAKNIGLIKFTGKLGNLSGRDTPYGNIISTPGGFKGDRIKTEERYLATRQLSSEFGRCAKISSKLHSSLLLYLNTIPQLHVYGYLQGQLTAIKACDTLAPKGERSVGSGLQTKEGRALLKNFSFNKKKNLQRVIQQPTSVDFEKGECSILGLDSSRIVFSENAKMAAIQLVLLRLDTETPNCYMETSAFTIISINEPKQTLTLECSVPEGNGFLIALVYFGFCNTENDEVYFLKHKRNVLEVVDIL